MARLGRGHIRDITGQRFGMLIARTPIRGISNNVYWECDCDCGKKTRVRLGHLLTGNIKGCGCQMGHRTHGHTKGRKNSPEYSVWCGMLRRCYNPRDKTYPNYGGRGIKVCDRWMMFENFFADMGKRPSAKHSLDRFPNPEGNYEPSNCRWATTTQQMRNRRHHRMLTYNGETLCLAEWAERYGLPQWLLRQRYFRDNLPIEVALNKPRS